MAIDPAPAPNIPNNVVFAPGRNDSVSYNYVWDNGNQYWTPQKQSSLGLNSITAQASDFIHNELLPEFAFWLPDEPVKSRQSEKQLLPSPH